MKAVTHNGRFHCDEVLAFVLLRIVYPDAELVRTRKFDVINGADVVFDVGDVFDPDNNRFDHHQSTFSETFNDKTAIKMSSAGLIYKYLGKEVFEKYGLRSNDEFFETVFETTYNEYILGVDGIDNGCDTHAKYHVRSLPDIVSQFNGKDTANDAEQYERFFLAYEYVKTDFANFVRYQVDEFIPRLVATDRVVMESDDPIIVTSEEISMKSILDAEKKYNKDIKFVIFPGAESSRIYAVPKSEGSFEPKLPLCKKWRGMRGDELFKASGIPGAIFVHASGHTGGNETVDGAIQMCKVTIDSQK